MLQFFNEINSCVWFALPPTGVSVDAEGPITVRSAVTL